MSTPKFKIDDPAFIQIDPDHHFLYPILIHAMQSDLGEWMYVSTENKVYHESELSSHSEVIQSLSNKYIHTQAKIEALKAELAELENYADLIDSRMQLVDNQVQDLKERGK